MFSLVSHTYSGVFFLFFPILSWTFFSSHPAFRQVGRSHHCSSFTHIRRHTPVTSCHFFGMRDSRIPRLSRVSFVGLFCPQSQPMHPTGAIPERPRLPSPGSRSSLCFHSVSQSASQGGFPPCKIARHFTPPSVSVLPRLHLPMLLQPLLQPLNLLLQLYLWVSPRHPPPPLSLPLMMMASPRCRASGAVLEPPRPPWLVSHPRNPPLQNRSALHSKSPLKMVFRHLAGCCTQLPHHQGQAGSV